MICARCMNSQTRLFLAVALLIGWAASAAESAAEISRKARERGALNLMDLTAEIKLVTVGKEGKTKEQVVTASSRKIGGRTHSLSRFSKPPSVAGVAVLTVEGAKGEGNQISLYLPNLRRVRKVAPSQRGESFMDTDFSYADLGGMGTSDSELEQLPEQKVDGRDAFVIAGPGGADSPYGRVTLLVDKETYVPLRVDYQDKEGKPFKTFRALKLKRFKDRTMAAESVMENLKTGSKTTLQVVKLEESKLGEEAFSERALERG